MASGPARHSLGYIGWARALARPAAPLCARGARGVAGRKNDKSLCQDSTLDGRHDRAAGTKRGERARLGLRPMRRARGWRLLLQCLLRHLQAHAPPVHAPASQSAHRFTRENWTKVGQAASPWHRLCGSEDDVRWRRQRRHIPAAACPLPCLERAHGLRCCWRC